MHSFTRTRAYLYSARTHTWTVPRAWGWCMVRGEHGGTYLHACTQTPDYTLEAQQGSHTLLNLTDAGMQHTEYQGQACALLIFMHAIPACKDVCPCTLPCRCLTCDREIRTQNGGTPPKDAKAKGTFLPRLEGMPASPGAPVGPGINAGELRRLAEERATG